MEVDIQKIEKIEKEVEVFLYDNQNLAVNTKDDYVKAADTLKLIQQRIKIVEEKRKEYTQPMVEAKRRIDADFKRISDPLEAFVADVKAKMLGWYKIDQARLIEEQKKIDAEAMANLKKGNESEAVVQVVINQNKTVRGDVATITVRKLWRWKVIDESKLPDDYWIVDESKLNLAVKDGTRSIPGVEIFQEDQAPTIR